MKSISLRMMLLATVLMSIVACKNDSSPKELRTESGYVYSKVRAGKGAKVEPGSNVSFKLIIQDDKGKVLQDATNAPYPSLQIPKADAPKPPMPNPLVDMIAAATQGDSLVLIMPKDSIKMGLPPGSEDLQHMEFAVSIETVEDQATYEARIAKLKAEKAAKTKAVESIVGATAESIKNGSANIQSTASGLKYIIHEEGTGAMPQAGDRVNVDYYGTLASDGKMFDNSYSRGQPFSFVVGQGMVIKGWDEGLPLMKEGGKATLIIPSELGYGDSGAGADIPGGATLHFYVELKDIVK